MSSSETRRSAPTDDDSIVRLRLNKTVRVDVDRVPDALGARNAPWLGTRMPESEASVRHFLCDLEVTLGSGRPTKLRKSAIVGFGRLEQSGEQWVVPIEWRAATMAPLFPVFAGFLRIGPDKIELDGRYAPPFGKLGFVMDTALLGVAARGTARWFIEKLARVLA